MELIESGYQKKEGVDYVLRDACYGLVEKDDKLLLVYSHKDNNYSIPGGGMETGETRLEALKREFMEETGCTILKAKEILNVHFCSKKLTGIYVEQFCHIFKVKIDENNIVEPLENWHDRVYVDKDKFLDMVDSMWQKDAFKYIFKIK